MNRYIIIIIISILIVFLLLTFLLPGNNLSSEIGKSASLFKNIIKLAFVKPEPKNLLQSENRTNFLILGRAGEGNPAPDLTDTIMILSIKNDENKVALISIPRDLLVKIPDSENTYTKINSLYAGGDKNTRGINLIKNSVEEIAEMPIHYYILTDLETVKMVIDEIGGINIFVEDISDPMFPGPNYSYQIFSLKSGWRWLDGDTALKYIRTRNNENGDFGRMRRQQQVLRAVKDKVLSLNLLWNLPKFITIFYNLNDHVLTDLKIENVKTLAEIIKSIPGDSLIAEVIDNNPDNGLLTGDQVMLGGNVASVLRPRAGDFSEIQKLVKYIFQETKNQK